LTFSVLNTLVLNADRYPSAVRELELLLLLLLLRYGEVRSDFVNV